MPAILFDGRSVSFKLDGDSIYLDGKKIEFSLVASRHGRLLVRIGNSVREIVYDDGPDGILLFAGDFPVGFEVMSDRDVLLRSLDAGSAARHKHVEIKAPMPGLVVKTLVREGDSVKRGGTLLILEAMKMENEIRTPVDAVVGQVLVNSGEVVEKDQVIVTFR